MAGFVKLMSGENLPDSDAYKRYQLISLSDGGKVEFEHNAEGLDICIVHLPGEGPEEYLMHGNVYILSESGKTISSRGTNVPGAKVDSTSIVEREDVTFTTLRSLRFGDITAGLSIAAKSNEDIVPAIGEFLAGLVLIRNDEAIKAVRHAASFLK